MHVIMVSVGSWGDAEPYLALAQELLLSSSSHNNHNDIVTTVDFFVQQEYESRVQQIMTTTSISSNNNNNNNNKKNPFLQSNTNNFRLHALPFSTRDFYKVKNKNKPTTSESNNGDDPKLKHVETIAEIIGELVLPCAKWMHSIISLETTTSSSKRRILLSSALSRPLCWLLSRALKIPMVLLHLQPLAPNVIFPLYRVSKNRCVQAILEYENNKSSQQSQITDHHSEYNNNNEASYWKIDEPLEQVFLKDRIRAAYSEHYYFGIMMDPPSWSELQIMLQGKDPSVHIANCFSNHLFPQIVGTPGVGPNIHEIGSLADSFLPHGYYSPDPELDAFLKTCWEKKNKRPICIGFGSMPFAEVAVILDALLELGDDMPAILLGAPFQFQSCPKKYQDLFRLDDNGDRRRVVRIGFVPYAHLLPQCSMMLCHGGAGVVHATIRAGIPCLIRPIMGDQFLFASLLEQKGLGMQIGGNGNNNNGNISKLKVDDIVTAVRQVQSEDSGIAANCRKLRQTILQEEASGAKPHGTVKLVNLLERILIDQDQE